MFLNLHSRNVHITNLTLLLPVDVIAQGLGLYLRCLNRTRNTIVVRKGLGGGIWNPLTISMSGESPVLHIQVRVASVICIAS